MIRELATGRYLETVDNLLLLGPPSFGKTISRWPSGSRRASTASASCFTAAAGLIATLGKGMSEGHLDERLTLLAQPQLLIIDEIGYIPMTGRAPIPFFSWCPAATSAARSS